MDRKIRTAAKKLLDRPSDSNKYDFGHVLVIGGSPGMVGAPLLVAEAAMRSGAGLTTIASSHNVIDKLERRVKEIMALRLTDPNQNLSPASAVRLKGFIQNRKVSSLVIGPGLSRSAQAGPFIRKFLASDRLPTVIDADALYALAGHLQLLRELGEQNPDLVLTPHAGEYRRLTKDSPASFAKSYGIHLVLKGPDTKIFAPDGSVYQNTTGNPGLATAGSGDVLGGVIAALIGQGLSTNLAACAGVYLHGLAGDLAAKASSQPSVIASDIIRHLPAAFKRAAGRGV